jgi:DNA transformation protein and related proteins
MPKELIKQVNIGKDTEAKLKQVGIHSVEDLISVGSRQAFLRLQTLDPGACLSLLYGLDGAVEGVKSKDLSARRKLELIEFFHMCKKK